MYEYSYAEVSFVITRGFQGLQKFSFNDFEEFLLFIIKKGLENRLVQVITNQ